MSDECIHGLGPVAACTICNGKDRIETVEPFRTFPAKYEGTCGMCHLPIRIGDLIAWREGEHPIHDGCRP